MMLQTLRSSSCDLHQKIEIIGISGKIKKDTLTFEDYRIWISVVYAYHRQFLSLFDHNYLENCWSKLLPSKDILSSLEKDFNAVCGIPLPVNQLSVPNHNDFFCVPIYLLAGSKMGSKIILKHIQNKDYSWPSAFLQASINEEDSWQTFLNEINNHTFSVDPESIGQFSEQCFEYVLDIYQLANSTIKSNKNQDVSLTS